MERVMRNFFHNISDILLAILIVAICAGVIFWRMHIIMQYPEKVVNAQQQQQVEQQDEDATETDVQDDAADEEAKG